MVRHRERQRVILLYCICKCTLQLKLSAVIDNSATIGLLFIFTDLPIQIQYILFIYSYKHRWTVLLNMTHKCVLVSYGSVSWGQPLHCMFYLLVVPESRDSIDHSAHLTLSVSIPHSIYSVIYLECCVLKPVNQLSHTHYPFPSASQFSSF